jgi:hypothetical protein
VLFGKLLQIKHWKTNCKYNMIASTMKNCVSKIKTILLTIQLCILTILYYCKSIIVEFSMRVAHKISEKNYYSNNDFNTSDVVLPYISFFQPKSPDSFSFPANSLRRTSFTFIALSCFAFSSCALLRIFHDHECIPEMFTYMYR